MGAARDLAAPTPPVGSIPTSTTQAKRLALLYGPEKWWKPPLAYGLAYPGRLDAARLELTLRLLARRHSGLRIYFLPGQPIDVAGCLPADEAVWPLRVVSAGTDEETEEVADAYAWLQRGFDPFDRPLLRALLLRRAGDDVLGLTIDHSLFDGYSARVLLEDLAHVYDGLATRPASAFDRLESDAVRFARDERRWLAGEEGAAALSWWDRHNAGLGAYPRLNLPETAPRDPDAPCAHYGLALSTEDVAQLRQRTVELRLSSFMLAATATCVTLREYGPTDDVAFLFACFRRTWPSTARLVAYVANRSLMRIDAGRDDTLASLARRVRAAAVEAIRHGMLSHEQYLRIRYPDSYDRQPTIPNLLLNVMEQKPLPGISGRPWTTVPLPSPPGYQLPGIGMNLTLRADGTGELHSTYPEGMYDPGLVAHLTRTVARRCTTGT